MRESGWIAEAWLRRIHRTSHPEVVPLDLSQVLESRRTSSDACVRLPANADEGGT
jgi:hypothetical protein